MPVEQSNAIAGLKELKWRGLRGAPCSEVTCDFSHVQAALPYAYVDDEGHDWTGRACFKVQATLHFLNTLEADLYPRAWNEYRSALLDGKSGDLLHPDLGKIRARVADVSYAVRATERAGITVRVTWTSTIDKIEQPNAINAVEVSVFDAAKEADKALVTFGIDYPDGGDGTTSLGEAVSGVTGSIQQASTSVTGSVTSTIGQIDKVSGTIDQLHDAATATNDNAAWSLKSNLETLSAALADTKTALLEGARETADYVPTVDITLDTFARQVDNTVAEVVQLNPSALGQPAVPKGTTLRYYKAA